MIRRIPHPLLALCMALAAAACDAGPTDTGNALQVRGEGNAQEGVAGALLPAPLAVQVTQADGRVAPGVPVHFRLADGAGTLEVMESATTAQGIAWAQWRLPAQAGAPLAAYARVEGVDGEIAFTASMLPPGRADLVLADAEAPVRLLVHPAASLNPALAFRTSFTDSLPLAPFARAETRDALVALAPGRPPLVRGELGWTAARDTVRLAFGEPVAVPVTIWIIRGPYPLVAARMGAQMENARAIWAKAGIVFPDVRMVDATAFPNAHRFQDATPACGDEKTTIGFHEGRTNVYVSGGPLMRQGQRFGGYACGADHANIAEPSLNVARLLAHELGHTFGLVHGDGDNVMHASTLSDHVTAGQIFWAHVNHVSSIPTRYAGAAALPTRNCFSNPELCLPAMFDW